MKRSKMIDARSEEIAFKFFFRGLLRGEDFSYFVCIQQVNGNKLVI